MLAIDFNTQSTTITVIDRTGKLVKNVFPTVQARVFAGGAVCIPAENYNICTWPRHQSEIRVRKEMVTTTRSRANIAGMLAANFTDAYTIYENHMCAIDTRYEQFIFFCSRNEDGQYGLALCTPKGSRLGFNPEEAIPGAQPLDSQQDEYFHQIVYAEQNMCRFFPLPDEYTTNTHPAQEAVQTVVFMSNKDPPIELRFAGKCFTLESDNSDIIQCEDDTFPHSIKVCF
jgi:hypothetical protein